MPAAIALTDAVQLPQAVRPSVRFVLNKMLRTAIILLGAGLTLASIVSLGAAALWLVLICVCVATGIGAAANAGEAAKRGHGNNE